MAGSKAATASICAMASRPSSTTFSRIDRPTFTAKDPLPKGKTTLAVDFNYDGGGMGKGGTITMSRERQEDRRRPLERTIPVQFSLAKDWTSAWTLARRSTSPTSCRLRFTGNIEKVTVELKPRDLADKDLLKQQAEKTVSAAD